MKISVDWISVCVDGAECILVPSCFQTLRKQQVWGGRLGMGMQVLEGSFLHIFAPIMTRRF